MARPRRRHGAGRENRPWMLKQVQHDEEKRGVVAGILTPLILHSGFPAGHDIASPSASTFGEAFMRNIASICGSVALIVAFGAMPAAAQEGVQPNAQGDVAVTIYNNESGRAQCRERVGRTGRSRGSPKP